MTVMELPIQGLLSDYKTQLLIRPVLLRLLTMVAKLLLHSHNRENLHTYIFCDDSLNRLHRLIDAIVAMVQRTETYETTN